MAFFPELWADKTLEAMLRAQQDTQRIVNSITDYTPFCKGKKANGYNGPKLSGLTVRTLPASGSDTPAQDSINFSFDQSKGVIFTVSDIDIAQASVDMVGELTAQAGVAILDDYDSFLLKLMVAGLSATSGYKNTIADAQGNKLTLADIRAARKKLNKSKAPKRGRYMAVDPEMEDDLYDIPQFISRDKIADTSAMRDGVIGRVMGFDVILAADMPKVTDAWSQTEGTLSVALFYSSFSTGFGRNREMDTKMSPDALVPGDTTNIYSVYGGKVQDATMIVGYRKATV